MSDKVEFKTLVEEDDGADAVDRNTVAKRPGQLPTPVPPARPTTRSGEVTPLKDETKRQYLLTRAEGLRTIILLFVVISFGITVALAIEIVIGETQMTAHGGVASSNENCADLAVFQLKKGGSAVDAAITSMLCLSVVQPQSAGLGGGGVMIIHEQILNKTIVLDFRETAPMKLTKDRVKTEEETDFLRSGGLSVGVPGEVRGIYVASQMYGKLPWHSLFEPVIKLAEDGFKVSKKLANDILKRQKEIENYPQFQNIFFKDGKIPYAEGDIMKRKDLAKVFRILAAKDGVDAFYNGSIALEIVEAVNAAGGVMTVEDLKHYKVERREPLIGNFNGWEIVTAPAPFSGSLLLYMLNEFEETKVDSLSEEYFTKLSTNLINAFKCRSKLGDPLNFAEVSENERKIANKSEQHFCETAGFVGPEDRGTAHVSVVDKDELFVASTTTLNLWFGSLIVTRSGILLNNEMADFAHPNQVEAVFNQVGPGRRPLSSMVPTIAYRKDKPCSQRIAIGGVNGTRITSSVAQTLINLLGYGMPAKDAVVSQKMFCTEKECELEGGFSNVGDIAKLIKQELGVGVKVMSKKLAQVGVVVKKNSDTESYADESLGGKGITY